MQEAQNACNYSLVCKAGSCLLVPSLLRKLHDSKNRGCRIRAGSVHAQLDWDEQTSQRKTGKRFTCNQSNSTRPLNMTRDNSRPRGLPGKAFVARDGTDLV